MAALHRTLARRPSQIGKVAAAFPPARNGAAPLQSFLPSFRQRLPLFQPPIPSDRLSLRVGGKIRERIRGLNPERIRLGLLLPPPGTGSTLAGAEEATAGMYLKRTVRALQIDAARARLRAVGASCIARSEFFSICYEAAGGEKGTELAQSLDSSGAVIVWNDVVFLRPEEVGFDLEIDRFESGSKTGSVSPLSLLYVVVQSNRERLPAPFAPLQKTMRRRSREGRIGEDGKGEGGDRPERGGAGEEGTVVRAGVSSGADGSVRAADLLGAVVGRDGADLLLCDLFLLHGWLHLLPPRNPPSRGSSRAVSPPGRSS